MCGGNNAATKTTVFRGLYFWKLQSTELVKNVTVINR